MQRIVDVIMCEWIQTFLKLPSFGCDRDGERYVSVDHVLLLLRGPLRSYVDFRPWIFIKFYLFDLSSHIFSRLTYFEATKMDLQHNIYFIYTKVALVHTDSSIKQIMWQPFKLKIFQSYNNIIITILTF